MTASGPTSRSPETAPEQAVSAAGSRSARFTYANMLRSLLPLVVISLVVVGWNALRSQPGDPVRQIDPSSTVQLAASRAAYQIAAPAGLAAGYRPTSARTDAGDAAEGDPVTLQIGYVTPAEQYVGFVVSDDSRTAALRQVLDGAAQKGNVQIGGSSWTRWTTERGETALSREQGGVTVLVTGSASEAELETVAGAVRPYTG